METQTEEAKVSIWTDIHLHGKVEVDSSHKDAYGLSFTFGQVRLYFDKEEDFKAFVGEMIKAVANLK